MGPFRASTCPPQFGAMQAAPRKWIENCHLPAGLIHQRPVRATSMAAGALVSRDSQASSSASSSRIAGIGQAGTTGRHFTFVAARRKPLTRTREIVESASTERGGEPSRISVPLQVCQARHLFSQFLEVLIIVPSI